MVIVYILAIYRGITSNELVDLNKLYPYLNNFKNRPTEAVSLCLEITGYRIALDPLC